MVENIKYLPHEEISVLTTEIWEVYYLGSSYENSPSGMDIKIIDRHFSFALSEEEADQLMKKEDRIKLQKRSVKIIFIKGEYFILRKFSFEKSQEKPKVTKPSGGILTKEEIDCILSSIGQPHE